jgi:hypothetical protein
MRYPFKYFRTVFTLCFLLQIEWSCTKNLQPQNYSPTELNAAAVIANDILPLYGGLVTEISNCQSISMIKKNCSISVDSTLTGANLNNAGILFDYRLLLHYVNSCNNNTLNVNFNGDNSYQGLNYTSADQSSGTFAFVKQTSSTYLFTGFSTRTGSQRIKTVGANSFKSTIEFNSIYLTIDRITNQIISGKLNVKMYDASSDNAFYYNGNVVFSGSDKAILTLDSGRQYLLSW